MAGKVLVGGTAYTIVGGKACVSGTAYSITGGKTLIGGAAYKISFKEYTLEDLLSRMTVVNAVGIDASTAGTIQMAVPANGTYYLLIFFSGYIGIHRIEVSGGSATSTAIIQSASGYCYPTITTQNEIIMRGQSTGTYFGGTMALVQFGAYTSAEADSIFGACTLVRVGGRNNKSAGQIAAATSSVNGKIVAVATNTDFAFSYVATGSTSPQVIFGTSTACPSLLYYTASSFYLSTNGTQIASVHGGSVITMN